VLSCIHWGIVRINATQSTRNTISTNITITKFATFAQSILLLADSFINPINNIAKLGLDNSLSNPDDRSIKMPLINLIDVIIIKLSKSCRDFPNLVIFIIAIDCLNINTETIQNFVLIILLI
jgi:hypothetical protein